MKDRPRKDYNIYNIKETDTLTSIADFLKMKEYDVICFHNLYAKNDELMSMEFGVNQKILYITPNISEKEIEGIPKVQFDYDRKLGVKRFKEVLKYEVKQQVEIGKSKIIKEYEMSVFLKEQKETLSLFEVNLLTTPAEADFDSILEDMLANISKAIYPLQLIIDYDGNWFEVYNFDAIVKRYKTVRNEILDTFDGKIVVENLTFYDTQFENKEKFTELLKKDVFLNSYFNSLYANHTYGNYFVRTLDFPMLPNIKNVSYKVEQEIEEFLNPNNKITIVLEGEIEDQRAIADFDYQMDEPYHSLIDSNAELPYGEYKANYILNGENHCLEKATVNCFIELAEMREIKIDIKLLLN
jgi:hypothetical protein